MKVIKGVANIREEGPKVVTIGTYDGVHRGHRKVLGAVKRRAREAGVKSCVLTFAPHPGRILYPRKELMMLSSLDHRLRLLAEEEMDITVIIGFTKGFASLSPGAFFKNILTDGLNAREIFVGGNFMFGKGKSGGIAELRDYGRYHNIEVHAVKPLESGGKVISSTLIRNLIVRGDLSAARRLLGRRVSVLGTVVAGVGRGKGLGFPTANLDPHNEAIPPSGVYVAGARLNGRHYGGVLNIGSRPTFFGSGKKPRKVIEVHIFDFNGRLYGEDMEVVFFKKIREEKRFAGEAELVKRIKKDAALAKNYLLGARELF